MTAQLAIARLAFATTARRLPLPGGISLMLAWVGIATAPPRIETAGIDLDANARLWLLLPTAVLTLVALAAALDAWPLWTRDRPGRAEVARLQPRFGQGCMAATAGALGALALGLAAIASLFHGVLLSHGTPASVEARVALHAVQEPPVLDRNRRHLALRPARACWLRAITLSPLVGVGDPTASGAAGFAAAQLRLSADGAPLGETPLRIGGSHAGVRVEFAARRVEQIELEAIPGSHLWLLFAPGTAHGIDAAGHSAWLNTVLTALTLLLPASLALLLAAVLRSWLSRAVAIGLATALVLGSTALEHTPVQTSVAAFAAGRWIPPENPLEMWAVSLCMTVVLAASAILMRCKY